MHIFSLRKGFKEPNDAVREKGLSCLSKCPATRLWKFHLYPLSPLSKDFMYRYCPPPQGQNVPVNVYTLSTPISVLFWVFVRTNGIKIWRSFNHCFARVQWTWRRSSILEFSLFCKQKLAFFFGARFFLFLLSKVRRADNDMSAASPACDVTMKTMH
jgi:hypothetical protein